MNHEQRDTLPGRSPEQGGTSSDELAYRLHQQELLASFGVLALSRRISSTCSRRRPGSAHRDCTPGTARP
jgi:hypothetical protein